MNNDDVTGLRERCMNTMLHLAPASMDLRDCLAAAGTMVQFVLCGTVPDAPASDAPVPDASAPPAEIQTALPG